MGELLSFPSHDFSSWLAWVDSWIGPKRVLVRRSGRTRGAHSLVIFIPSATRSPRSRLMFSIASRNSGVDG